MSTSRSEPAGRGANGQPTGTNSSADRASAILERRYRRLLGWYPADYRRTYGEEILGVLLTAARAGRSRPSPAEAVNLAWSGLRARVSGVGTSTDPRWRDALAVYSLLAPIIATVPIYGNSWFLGSLLWRGGPDAGPLALPYPFAVLVSSWILATIVAWLTIAAPLIPVVLALLRFRRTALIASTWLLIWVTVDASYSWRIQAPNTIAFIVLLALEVAALALSDGPRRGLRLLSWKGVLLAGPWLVVVAVIAVVMAPTGVFPGLTADGKYLALVAIVALAATLVSVKTRRVVVLFTIPAAPFAVYFGTGYPKSTAAMFVTPALLALITFVVSRSRRGRGGDADSDVSPAIPAR